MPHEASTTASSTSLNPGTRLRLSIMMFLQYFAWGSWFVTMGSYIGANTAENGAEIFSTGFIGIAYQTAAIGGMIAPFFVGMVADRFFSTERILCVLHLAGAGVLYYLSTVHSENLFWLTLIAFFLCYMPTLALTNSLSFHHLTDPGRQFPGIRVWGTIGWIVAGLIVGGIEINNQSIEPTNIPMKIGSGCMALLGLYCLALPHTPPTQAGRKITASDILGLKALGLMRNWSFAVFVVGSFLIAIPLQFYYNYTNFFLNNLGVDNAAGKMTYGQMSEIFFMLLMPFFFARLGVKYMLLVGMAAWTARYVLFAYGNPQDLMWMLYIGILLHGICYDFFFVTGQIYVDNKADPSIRGAAQGFIAFATLGVGAFIGAKFSSVVERMYNTPDGPYAIDWHKFWLVPAAGAAVVMVLFAISFYDRTKGAAGRESVDKTRAKPVPLEPVVPDSPASHT